METSDKPEHLNKPKPFTSAKNVTAALAHETRGGASQAFGGGRQGTAAERAAARRVLALREDNSKRLDGYLRVSRTALICEARKIVSCRAAAEDAVQDAAVKAIQTSNQFDASRALDPERGFRAWFHQILVNVCIDQTRAASRRIAAVPFTSVPEIVVEEASVDPAPDVWEQVMRRRAFVHGEFTETSLWEAMQGVWHLDPLYADVLSRYSVEDFLTAYHALSATDRQILKVCVLDGKEEIEAAKEMKCSAGCVRSRLSVAVQRLRRDMTHLGYKPHLSPASPSE